MTDPLPPSRSLGARPTLDGLAYGALPLLEPGVVVGDRYEILEHLGSGGCGDVYCVVDRLTEARVALKRMRAGAARNDEALAAFRRELLTARQLTHVGVLPVYDLGLDGEIPFFTMKYASGGSLRRRMVEGGRIPPTRAIEIVHDLADTLVHVHERLAHGDIKPENLLLGEDGRVYLCDFGIARLPEDGRTAPLAGTFGYLAPEQLRSRDQADSRADIYAAGLLFYELLTGSLPTYGCPAPSAVNSDVDPRVDLVVSTATNYSPEKRFRNAAELRAALASIGAGAAPSPSPTSHREVESRADEGSSRAAIDPTRKRHADDAQPHPTKSVWADTAQRQRFVAQAHEAIAKMQGVAGDKGFVIVRLDPYYLQFVRRDDSCFWAEVVYNDNLPEQDQLGSETLEQLAALGWTEESGGNLSQIVPVATEADIGRLARLLTRTAEIYLALPNATGTVRFEVEG